MRNAKHMIGRRGGRGFSLVEVMLAVFILAIGLIMVAGVFPVGAEWTREDWEDSMGQIIGRNAVAIIQTKYSRADLIKSDGTSYLLNSDGTSRGLVPLPLFAQRLPLEERAYGLGQAQPFPATTATLAQQAQYFWTALIRQAPAIPAGTVMPSMTAATNQSKYALFIFVLRKPGSGQVFTADFASNPSKWAMGNGTTANWLEMPASPDRLLGSNTSNYGGTRVTVTTNGVAMDGASAATLGVPYLATMSAATFGTWSNVASGNALPASQSFSTAGWIAVGQYSGTVSRSVIYYGSAGSYTTAWRPALGGADANVIFAPPADGTTLTPLVYVYQTTVEF